MIVLLEIETHGKSTRTGPGRPLVAGKGVSMIQMGSLCKHTYLECFLHLFGQLRNGFDHCIPFGTSFPNQQVSI